MRDGRGTRGTDITHHTSIFTPPMGNWAVWSSRSTKFITWWTVLVPYRGRGSPGASRLSTPLASPDLLRYPVPLSSHARQSWRPSNTSGRRSPPASVRVCSAIGCNQYFLYLPRIARASSALSSPAAAQGQLQRSGAVARESVGQYVQGKGVVGHDMLFGSLDVSRGGGMIMGGGGGGGGGGTNSTR